MAFFEQIFSRDISLTVYQKNFDIMQNILKQLSTSNALGFSVGNTKTIRYERPSLPCMGNKVINVEGEEVA